MQLIAFFRVHIELVAAQDQAGLLVDQAHLALDSGGLELAQEWPELERFAAQRHDGVVRCDFGEERRHSWSPVCFARSRRIAATIIAACDNTMVIQRLNRRPLPGASAFV